MADVIRKPEDLALLRKRGLGIILLDLDHEQRERWQEELNVHYHACGCDTGEKAMLLGSIISIAIIIVLYVPRWRAASGIAFVVTLGCAGLGKWIGIVRARRKLARTIREIEAAWRV